MLARSGPLPTRGDFSYEVKWDGFRAIVSTESGLRLRSRRGWDMTERVSSHPGEAWRARTTLSAVRVEGRRSRLAVRCWIPARRGDGVGPGSGYHDSRDDDNNRDDDDDSP
jgi:hypothetical protein